MKNRFCLSLLSGFLICISSLASISGEEAKTGTFSGVIKFEGDISQLPPLVKRGAVVKNVPIGGAPHVPDESLVINPKNRGIANVFVYLEKLPKNVTISATPDQVVLTAQDFRYSPHVQIVQTGQIVQFANNDPVPQNFKVNSVQNLQLNRTLGPQGQGGFGFVYKKAERYPIKIVSEFNPWMSAWHLVLDHPFAAMTDNDGQFKLENLPAGQYQFLIWQEKGGYLEKKLEVTIEAGKETKKSLKYKKEDFED